ncbi:MAG TPA: HupE/UreJ family protein [Bauldia sp.]|nr:HupE/UreJ family protein [Bauldia sp.]
MLKRLPPALAIVLAATAPAFAHFDPHGHGSFFSGFTHPLLGLDHIVVMVAVGLWAATVGGRATAVIPAAFVGAMAIGYVLALAGVALPFVEPVILASVVTLGLFIASAVRFPIPLATTLVGVFAIFHGQAHGEGLGAVTALPYGIGFALATTLLHAAGIGIGLLLVTGVGLGKTRAATLSRVLGGAGAAIGVALALGAG